MSAIDNAFIRAFKTDAATPGGSPAKATCAPIALVAGGLGREGSCRRSEHR